MAVDSTAELRDLPPVQVVKREPFRFQGMTRELVQQWSEAIPSTDKTDIRRPEWRPTPLKPLDLENEHYGHLWIKDESDPESNPTGTIKDRAAHELITLHRDNARVLDIRVMTKEIDVGELSRYKVPVLSIITAGNEGLAIARGFAKYNLPPPNLILDTKTQSNVIDQLKQERASVFLVDLSNRELTAQDILKLSDNRDGIDWTSNSSFEPQSILYDWHVHEVLNELPDEIYVPYGTGRLDENYLHWQMKSARSAGSGKRDPRLRVEGAKVAGINVFAGEPENPDSVADKLVAKFKPFLLFRDSDITGLKRLGFSGKDSSVGKVSEEYIKHAHQLLKKRGIAAEPSAAAGLALYMQRWDQGLANPRNKVIVVNTGKGLYEEQEAIEAAA